MVNMVSDIDHDEGMLPVAAGLIDRLGKPVINHPNRIHATDRASIAALLSDIASCRAARVERHSGAALLAPDFYLRHAVPGPFLARLAGCHGGDDFERIESADDLRRLVSREPDGDYFLIEYLDYRSADGYSGNTGSSSLTRRSCRTISPSAMTGRCIITARTWRTKSG